MLLTAAEFMPFCLTSGYRGWQPYFDVMTTYRSVIGYKLSCCDFYEDEWEMKELIRKYPVAAAGPKEDLNRQLKRDMVA